MDSSSSRLNNEQTRQADIRRQIALLQAQLVDLPSERTVPQVSTPKRKHQDSSVLAPSTPSPKKRKLKHKNEPSQRQAPPTRQVLQNSNGAPPRPDHMRVLSHIGLPEKPKPSNLLNKLAALGNRPTKDEESMIPNRSTGFHQNTRPSPALESSRSARTDADNQPPTEVVIAPKRDDRLALIEELEIGPYEHKPPFDDPNFERLEPNSGIRLSSRTLSNDDMQEYLRGRYYLSPSRLYSVARLLPNKQGYDVPVAGDWVTIAVVAERGPVKFTRPPVGIGNDDDGDGLQQTTSNSASQKRPQYSKATGKRKSEPTAASAGKKYVNVKLIDFGARSRSSSSATGGKDIIRGDAFLTLLLFESDGMESITREDGKIETMYRGGSRGAFESMSKLKEGDVVALLNPKILRPFQRNNDQPHPTSNILALTPESAASIAVIGRALDLGMCAVVKRDGKVCGGWCDKRVSEVCEWHVQNAIERQRAGRAEFSMGTSGMSSTSGPKRKPAYDPARQWGLKPADSQEPGSATYVISGHTVNGSGSDQQSFYVAESIGREGQAKAKRILASKDADRALKALLERDKDGMKAVLTAREFVAQDGDHKQVKGTKGRESRTKAIAKADHDQDMTADPGPAPSTTHSYSATVIKNLGFDPAVRAGRRRPSDTIVQGKLETLSEASANRTFHLGRRPGSRIRSGVVPPQGATHSSIVAAEPGAYDRPESKSVMVDLDDL